MTPSPKKGIGVHDLLDKVLLEADMLDLKANPNRRATGTIIESSLDKGRGYVYAIELILIEMFTGRFVFDAEDPREVLRMQLYAPVEIPHALACTPLGSIIARATEKDVAKRYNHTQDLYDDLRDAAATFQPVHRSTMMETDGSWRRSRSVHSVFTDINDLLVPPGAGAPVVPELRSKAKRGSIEVPLMGGNAGDNGTPMGGDPSDFDVTRLSLLIFGVDNFLIPAMIGITIALLIGKKWMEKGETKA